LSLTSWLLVLGNWHKGWSISGVNSYTTSIPSLCWSQSKDGKRLRQVSDFWAISALMLIGSATEGHLVTARNISNTNIIIIIMFKQ